MLRRELRVGFVLVLGLVLAGAWVCLGSSRRILELDRSISRRQEALGELGGLSAAIQDAQTACRTFVLTGEPAHLDSYRAAVRTASHRLADLRRDLAVDAVRSRRLESISALLVEWNLRLSEAFQLSSAAGMHAGLAVTGSEALRASAGQLDRAIAEVRRDTAARLAHDVEVSRRLRTVWLASLGLLLALATALPIGGYYALSRMLERGRSKEQALLQGNSVLRAVMESTPDAVFLKDLEGRYTFMNSAAARQLGRPMSEIIGHTSEELSQRPGDWVGSVEEEVLRTGRPDRFEETVREDGEQRTHLASYAPCRDDQGRVIGIVGTSQDITDRKVVEDELRDLTNALTNAVEGIARVDADGRYLVVNRSYAEMTGFGREELIGSDCSRTIHAEDRQAAADAAGLMLERGRSEIEIRGVRKDGSVFHKLALMVAVHDADGRYRGHYRFTKDVTERKREEALRRHLEDAERANRELDQSRREQLKMKDRFVSHVSHELRSPLTVIYDFATILEDGIAGELNATQREYVEILRRNVEQLIEMIGDLLDVTRLQTDKLSLERARVSLAEVVRDAVDSFRNAVEHKTIELAWDAAADLPPAYADPVRARQILTNLIGNAIKFTPTGGLIRLSARRSEDPGFLIVSVEDSGCGIAANEVDRIFESLYQSADHRDMTRKGLGLGLFITRDLVSRHGGRIWVESEPGKGSIFRFTLPVFSVSRVVQDLVRSSPRPLSSASLIHVEVRPDGDRDFSAADESVLAGIPAMLTSCIEQERDALLPRTSREGRRETSLVLVRDDAVTASEVLDAITSTLADRSELDIAGLRATAYLTRVDVTWSHDGATGDPAPRMVESTNGSPHPLPQIEESRT